MNSNEERENNVSDQERDFMLTIKNLTPRELSRLRVVCNEELNLDIPKVSHDLFKEIILKSKYYKEIIDCLEFVKKYLILEEYFDWLKSNLRAQIFTLIYMRKIIISTIGSINEDRKDNGDSYLHPPSYGKITLNANGDIIGQIYDLFDNYEIEFRPVAKDKKTLYIEKIRLLWSSVYGQCDYNDWLEEDSKNQIEWTKNYLKNKNHYVDNIYGISSSQLYKAVLLASLDLIEFESGILKKSEYQESIAKNNFIDRMKKSWNQKKSRDAGTTRKSYHLALKTNVKDRLDKMAEIDNMKLVDMLEMLINSEYESRHRDKYGNPP